MCVEWTFSSFSPIHVSAGVHLKPLPHHRHHNNRMWEEFHMMEYYRKVAELNWNKSQSEGESQVADESSWILFFRTVRRSPVSLVPTTPCRVRRKSFWLTFFFHVQSPLVWTSFEYLTLKHHQRIREATVETKDWKMLHMWNVHFVLWRFSLWIILFLWQLSLVIQLRIIQRAACN